MRVGHRTRSWYGVRSPRRAARGFTLVEVLVALAIVAFGIGALLAMLSSAADTTVYLRERSFAEWVALNRLAEVRLQPQMPARGKTTGDAELGGRRWRWEQEVFPVDVPGLVRIEVRVRPADGARDSGWTATVAAMKGNAVAPASGLSDEFDWSALAGSPGPDGQPRDGGGRARRPVVDPNPEKPPSTEPPTE